MMYQEPILDRASQLLEVGYRMKEKFKRSGGQARGRREKKAYNKFRKVNDSFYFSDLFLIFQDVFLLEERFQLLEKAYNRGVGPKLLVIIWAWVQLVLGFVA